MGEFNPNYFMIGALSSMISKISVSPLDRLKFLTQTKSNNKFKELVRDIYKNEGIKGFYKGVIPILTTSIPKSSIYFYSLNKIKTNLHDNYNFSPIKINFISGLSAGVITTTLLYPTDVVTSKYYYDIGKNKSLFDFVKSTFNQKQLFRGFTPTLIGAIPNYGLSYLLYTSIKDNKISLNDNVNTFVSSYTASLITQIFSYPFDTIRKKMQINDLDFIKTIKLITEKSVISMYQGFKISLIKTPISNGIYFMCAEFLLKKNIF